MNDYSREKKIIGAILGVIVVILLAIFTLKYIKEKPLCNDVREMYKAYQQEDYQLALVEANKLEEPYKSYYVDYINYAIEINGWNDTDDALYAWLLEVYESYKQYSKLDFPNNIENMKLWDIPIEESAFKTELEYIEDALVWYPQYCIIKNMYYDNLFSKMKANSDLYLAEAENGCVKISISKLVTDFESVGGLYTEFENSIENIKKSYKMNDVFNEYLDNELAEAKEFYENGYVASSIYTIYEDAINERGSEVVVVGESKNDFLYVSVENAKHNHEMILSNYDAVVYGSSSIAESFLEYLASDTPDEVLDNSIVVLEMYKIIQNMYVLESLEVQPDPSEVDICDLYEMYF